MNSSVPETVIGSWRMESTSQFWRESPHLIDKNSEAQWDCHSPSKHSRCCCCVASVVSDSVQPHRRQPTRLPCPWDSPGKNTGVGCHCLLPKHSSEVAISLPSQSPASSGVTSSKTGIRFSPSAQSAFPSLALLGLVGQPCLGFFLGFFNPLIKIFTLVLCFYESFSSVLANTYWVSYTPWI